MKEGFEDWLIGSGTYAITSARAAIRSIKFMEKSLDVNICGEEEIMEFVRSQIRKGRRNKTIQNQLHALRYYRIYIKNPIEIIKLKKQTNAETYVPEELDVERIFNYVEKIKDPAKRALYRSLVYVLAYTGARIGEVSALNLGDIIKMDDGRGQIYIKAEKGEASRSLIVPASVISAIDEYINYYRQKTDQRALFAHVRGRMTSDRLRMIIKKIGVAAGVPRLHSHSFRHRVATSLFNEGADLREVQRQLGHISASSTRVYDHSDREMTSRKNADRLEDYYARVRVKNENAGK